MTSPTRLPAVMTAAPLAAPRATGLLNAARVVTSLTGVRWGNGVDWLSELHPTTSEAFGARAIDCVDSTAIAHGADDKAPTGEADPFLVYAFDWCSAMEGLSQRDWEGRARRLLEATQSASIARELWSGALASARSLHNVWLAKTGSSVVGSGAKAPEKALALLDGHVATQLSNGRGMIHCTVPVLNRLMSASAIRLDAGVWVTATGTIVAADAGYSGDKDGQNATEEWMIATTIPTVVLGEMRFSKSDSPKGGEMVSPYNNDVLVYGERDVLVMHEPLLLHGATQVDLS